MIRGTLSTCGKLSQKHRSQRDGKTSLSADAVGVEMEDRTTGQGAWVCLRKRSGCEYWQGHGG